MKNLMIVFLFIFSAYLCTAQVHSEATAEVGIYPLAQFGGLNVYSRQLPVVETTSLLYDRLAITIGIFRYFYVGGSITTLFVNDPVAGYCLPNFDPFFTCYTFNAGVVIGSFSFNFEHQCDHPVSAWSFNPEDIITNKNQDYDKIDLKYTLRLGD